MNIKKSKFHKNNSNDNLINNSTDIFTNSNKTINYNDDLNKIYTKNSFSFLNNSQYQKNKIMIEKYLFFDNLLLNNIITLYPTGSLIEEKKEIIIDNECNQMYFVKNQKKIESNKIYLLSGCENETNFIYNFRKEKENENKSVNIQLKKLIKNKHSFDKIEDNIEDKKQIIDKNETSKNNFICMESNSCKCITF